jgi:tRNA-2-methylthio-N6-dimethylallyladenosine synthase
MVNDVPGNFWIRFATSHPKDMSDDLIKAIAECDKVCEHIHLPVQAGDNVILRRMNRKYTREHYIKLISRIRRGCNTDGREWQPPVAITTDIIVGFPGETREQFNQTAELFKEIKFDMAYIARYSPRPGTAAAQLDDDVPRAEKKRREEELMKILRKTALENNKKYLGKTVEVLAEGKNRKGNLIGKTRTFKNVECQMSNVKCNIGDFVKVKIKKAQDFGLEGEIVKHEK